ncbi:hypothetical protein HY463_00050 [Candidatus Peregrinibacteria bacterium]|nr:hypothetical protein [Candidatus Peregrinibacteria bacterium]
MANDALIRRLDIPEWDAPKRDELGSSVDRNHAFIVSTRAQLAEVLDFAAAEKLLVSPAGAFSSSSQFKSPPRDWMEKHGKNGIVLVGFDGGRNSEFSDLEVDTDAMTARAGAAVNLQALSDAVEQKSGGQLENLMTITTMNAGLVATLLGSGGVSDSAHSVDSLALGSEWMDGKGAVHEEKYIPGDYFDYSSFNEVDPAQVGREMSGRGGPFGIGLNACVKLFRAPVNVVRAIYPFARGYKALEVVRRDFLQTIVELNKARGQKGLLLEPRSFEYMDKEAIAIAREAMAWSPNLSEDTEFLMIVEFAQTRPADLGDTIIGTELYDTGFIPDVYADYAEGVYFIRKSEDERSDFKKLERFRLLGPDQIRAIRKRDFPKAPTVSTDFAVDASDEDLVQWHGNEIFALQDRVADPAARTVLYGHGFHRFDPHFRVVMPDEAAFQEHRARLVDLGHRFVRKEMGFRAEGRNCMRERGEKPELGLPGEIDAEVIGAKRNAHHKGSNTSLLRELDPFELFVHRARERQR